jgi:hypothetical protein
VQVRSGGLIGGPNKTSFRVAPPKGCGVTDANLAVRVHLRLLAKCETANQLNRLNIRYERRMVPWEQLAFSAVQKELGALCHRASQFSGIWIHPKVLAELRSRRARNGWLRGLLKQSKPLGGQPGQTQDRATAETWRRTFVTKGIAHYRRNPAAPSPFLLIAFTGSAQRLMMPMPTFLKSIEGLGADLLVVWARRGGRYEDGVPSLGDDLATSLGALAGYVGREHYQFHGVLAVSAGGVPGAIFALTYLKSRYILVGPGDPRRSAHLADWNQTLEQLGLSGIPPSGLVHIGKSAPTHDGEAAKHLSETLGIPITSSQGGHAPLHEMATSQTIEPWLRRFFLGPSDRGSSA